MSAMIACTTAPTWTLALKLAVAWATARRSTSVGVRRSITLASGPHAISWS